MSDQAELATGRKCGSCSLCCKVLRIEELVKEPGLWCMNCSPGGGGCKVYADRPEVCRTFLCGWLAVPDLGPEWFPESSRLVVSIEQEGRRLAIGVDPSSPFRWKEEPFYSRIKAWAVSGFERQQQILVNIGRRVIAVLPNKDVDLGIVEPDDLIMVGELDVPAGHPPDWGAYVEKAADIPPGHTDKWIIRGPHPPASELR